MRVELSLLLLVLLLTNCTPALNDSTLQGSQGLGTIPPINELPVHLRNDPAQESDTQFQEDMEDQNDRTNPSSSIITTQDDFTIETGFQVVGTQHDYLRSSAPLPGFLGSKAYMELSPRGTSRGARHLIFRGVELSSKKEWLFRINNVWVYFHPVFRSSDRSFIHMGYLTPEEYETVRNYNGGVPEDELPPPRTREYIRSRYASLGFTANQSRQWIRDTKDLNFTHYVVVYLYHQRNVMQVIIDHTQRDLNWTKEHQPQKEAKIDAYEQYIQENREKRDRLQQSLDQKKMELKHLIEKRARWESGIVPK